jgi:FlaA1/EpsC-like NDP-sugar epimerase
LEGTTLSAPVYLLDMGEPVKIYDLAFRMIELSGLSVFDDKSGDGDIEIKITGLRSGEKLYEELLIDDAVLNSSHPKIKYADERFISWAALEPELMTLAIAIEMADDRMLNQVLVRLVAGFSGSGKLHSPS